MLRVAASPALGTRRRTALEYALGKAFDDLGDYAEAIRHFDEANRLNRQLMRFDHAAYAAENERIMALFTPDFPASRTITGAGDETPLLIVGVPRSGTTLAVGGDSG